MKIGKFTSTFKLKVLLKVSKERQNAATLVNKIRNLKQDSFCVLWCAMMIRTNCFSPKVKTDLVRLTLL